VRILTFDIEDWYHFLEHRSTRNEVQWKDYEPRVRQNTANILNFLEKHNQKATFFIIGWVAKKNPGLVNEIANAGHDIGMHSYGHQLVWQQTPDEFRQDLLKNIGALEDQLGYKVLKYRAPGFSIKTKSLWALDIMAEAGIETDSSIFPAARAHGGMPSFPHNSPCIIQRNGISLKEFPINYNHLMGIRTVLTGGGYFRFWPYSVIDHYTSDSQYVMSYFHPRDFDSNQPILRDLNPYRKFRAYYGLHNSQQKLERWINEYPFSDIRTADLSIDWDSVPTVNL
jgi:polysaccharide deacetylase family protein (PEP-CTERM system associated)